MTHSENGESTGDQTKRLGYLAGIRKLNSKDHQNETEQDDHETGSYVSLVRKYSRMLFRRDDFKSAQRRTKMSNRVGRYTTDDAKDIFSDSVGRAEVGRAMDTEDRRGEEYSESNSDSEISTNSVVIHEIHHDGGRKARLAKRATTEDGDMNFRTSVESDYPVNISPHQTTDTDSSLSDREDMENRYNNVDEGNDDCDDDDALSIQSYESNGQEPFDSYIDDSLDISQHTQAEKGDLSSLSSVHQTGESDTDHSFESTPLWQRRPPLNPEVSSNDEVDDVRIQHMRDISRRYRGLIPTPTRSNSAAGRIELSQVGLPPHAASSPPSPTSSPSQQHREQEFLHEHQQSTAKTPTSRRSFNLLQRSSPSSFSDDEHVDNVKNVRLVRGVSMPHISRMQEEDEQQSSGSSSSENEDVGHVPVAEPPVMHQLASDLNLIKKALLESELVKASRSVEAGVQAGQDSMNEDRNGLSRPEIQASGVQTDLLGERINRQENELQEKRDAISHLQKAVEERDVRISDLDSVIQSQNEERNELQSKVQTLQTLADKITANHRSIETGLNGKLESQSREIASFKQRSQSDGQQISVLMSENKKLGERCLQLNADIQFKEGELSNLRKQLHSMTNETKELEGRCASYEGEIQSLQALVERHKGEVAHNQHLLRELEMKIEHLQRQSDIQKSNAERSQMQIASLEEKIYALKGKCTALESELEVSQQERRNEHSRAVQLEIRSEELASTLSTKVKSVDRLTKRNADLEVQLQSAIRARDSALKDGAALKEDISTLRHQLQQALSKIKYLENQVEQLQYETKQTRPALSQQNRGHDAETEHTRLQSSSDRTSPRANFNFFTGQDHDALAPSPRQQQQQQQQHSYSSSASVSHDHKWYHQDNSQSRVSTSPPSHNQQNMRPQYNRTEQTVGFQTPPRREQLSTQLSRPQETVGHEGFEQQERYKASPVHKNATSHGGSPFATEMSAQEEMQKIAQVEKSLMTLQLERDVLDGELQKLQSHGTRTLKSRKRKIEIERRLDEIARLTSSLRMELRRMNAL